jgi:hypothetical protein
VLVALQVGCAPAEDPPPAAVVSDEPVPAPTPTQGSLDELLRGVQNRSSSQEPLSEIGEPAPQAQVNDIGERTRPEGPIQDVAAPAGAVIARTVERLIYQCTGEVTFAVSVVGDRLEVYPPGHEYNYVALVRASSDEGVRFTARGAEFRAKDDLATLEIGGEPFVDCVSNPAAAVWQAPRRRR